MPQELLTSPVPTLAPSAADDSLGIDRAFAMQLARMPLFAILWVGEIGRAHV